MKTLPRSFKYNGILLDDPDVEMSPEEVKEFYSNIYPELTQAEIDGPEVGDETMEYVFRRVYGTKGISVVELAEGLPNKNPEADFQYDFELMHRIAEVALSPRRTKKPLPSNALEPI